MKKLIVFITVSLSLTVSYAQFMIKHEVPANSPLGKLRARDYAYAGGYIRKANTMKGKFLIANAQEVISATNLTAMAAGMTDESGFNFHYAKVVAPENLDWGALAKKENAAYVIGIVFDPKLPPMLVAPEAKWAIVNAAGLEDGMAQNAKQRFLVSRVRKEVVRSFALLCAGCQSKFGDSPLKAERPSDLDKYPEVLPPDVMKVAFDTLSAHGLQPRKLVAYRKACEEGWAPAPTNELQKAIWDKVHELPTKPIKILPETKPVKD